MTRVTNLRIDPKVERTTSWDRKARLGPLLRDSTTIPTRLPQLLVLVISKMPPR